MKDLMVPLTLIASRTFDLEQSAMRERLLSKIIIDEG